MELQVVEYYTTSIRICVSQQFCHKYGSSVSGPFASHLLFIGSANLEKCFIQTLSLNSKSLTKTLIYFTDNIR